MTVASRQRSKGGEKESPGPAVEETNVRIPASKAGEVRGGVTIAESVIEMLAATAAREVPGIYPGGPAGGITGEVTRAFGARPNGIRARIKRGREVSLDMRMAIDYGEHMPTRGEEVRIAVARAIQKLTDLETREIKVKISEVILPENRRPEDAAGQETELPAQ
jgi:uncharacterized alkaline shock family protein YloU